jgi:hypothetical protein
VILDLEEQSFVQHCMRSRNLLQAPEMKKKNSQSYCTFATRAGVFFFVKGLSNGGKDEGVL